MNRSKILALAISTLVAGALISAPAGAQTPGKTTLFSSTKGDVTFPITPPNNSGSVPGTLDNTVIGSGTPAPGSFSATTSTLLTIDTGTKTASATTGAATLNKNAGVITSEALTTAAGATYTLTLTNSTIAAADQVFASVQLGTATTGMPVVTTVTPAAGSVVIVVQNIHASAALNGTIKIAFARLKN